MGSVRRVTTSSGERSGSARTAGIKNCSMQRASANRVVMLCAAGKRPRESPRAYSLYIAMADRVSSAARSAIMARVKSTDTTPEMAVRRIVHGLGYRFRLHRRDLPGTPDLVFPKYRAVVFVNGCFWHQHECPRGRRQPSSNQEYWNAKLARNVARDRSSESELQQLGWRLLIIWECQIQSPDIANKIGRFLCVS